MAIDKRLLHDLTEEVDQMHHESMRTFRDEAHEIHFGAAGRPARQSRRRFLVSAGAGTALITTGAFASPLARFAPAAWAEQTKLDDGSIAMFAMSFEYAAVEVYQQVDATGKLSSGIARTVSTFAGHHQDHGDAFAAITKAADADKNANQKVIDAFSKRIADAKDDKALLEVAFDLEQAAAGTYIFALGELQDRQNAGAVATILPVESQHAVVLARALDKKVEDYLPAFETAKTALDPSEYSA